jgi:hypothetical protein
MRQSVTSPRRSCSVLRMDRGAGSYVPKRESETLNIFAACDSEDPSVTGHGHVLLDDISFVGGELCVWFDLEISAAVHKIKIVRLLCPHCY